MAWPNIFRRGTLFSRFSHHHVVVFLLTFFSYSLLHASRKTFSNVKVSISKQWTPSAFNKSVRLPVEIWSSNHLFPSAEEATLFLGTLDTIFLFSYAVGLFISGIVGDRLNLRWVLSFGMCSSALVVFVFGTVTEWLHFYNKGFYCCLWIVNGLLQSTGWPCVVAVMGNWFGKAGRGVVFGLWSACASVGNILGACLASSVLQYGYEYAFLVTAAVQFAGGIVIFFGLLVSPEEIGLPGIEAEENFEEDSHRPLINGAENEDEYEPNYSIQEGSTVTQVKAISFYQACCLPGVIPYSLAYACLKLVNYSFFFWLPFYLSNNFGWKEAEADKLSIWYDVGGIIGGTLQGFISDILQKRAPVLALSLLLAVGSLVGYSRSPNDKSINALLMAVTGFFIGGPSNMISSAISADLGRQELIQGSSEALATVTGIVDGTGSIGAAVGQYLVSLIQDNLGWMWVFYFFILMTSCTILFISPLIVREICYLMQRRQAHILSE
ncbi:sugar phosphate exchanger 3 isoform X1 [Callorhinus ursinus]|uniref:Sugar phosphate exchanger 3 n=1 Tax=Callorhinus ursinus TaxID=34884 RepID=A0A3Q7MTV6_CALUR|nr:sugar phosphate exchanger 3 isoform X1 [Callorhinus ursinus]XP_025710523.1 sugar phosphate exchanger 3 isoform X1 [Callorhinus ursinus]XP_025710524.1 sugar phosphate exchanger 3 isoform X1 [Callorhinus ursinus]XP_025710525.1 sugar phosphate exchanger 3 isoform X1 [Callorhinus ursinus]XP_025710526.1 sugar phosphate exchanger 3 isoform X1 [Callorhinus ursinus]XP_025710527.1 sugar phosphate exchanger 3 isoform X1 [Callorhinus ursinus]XP_025710528.1 sugar phosphate exchanger 3 isoform X1 [Call